MLDLDYYKGLISYIERLQKTKLPIFIYGMGDGCLKLLDIFERYSIPCSGIFASDEFVRDKTFMGHRIHRLSEIEDSIPEFIVVLAFGAGYKSLMNRIDDISQRHTLIIPDMPVVGDGLFTKQYMLEHFDELSLVHDILYDNTSKMVYEKLIEYRITGDIECLKSCETQKDEAYSLLGLSDSEIYADLGAYVGDTVLEFLEHIGRKYEKIIALEPNSRNFRKLTENTVGFKNIVAVNAAAGDVNTTITITKGGGRMIRRAENGVSISQVTLDSIIEKMSSNGCTYIKYDVEGAELEAINGSKKTIEMYKPKLNVALYHRVEDIYSLILYVHSLLPNHKLYIRHFPYYPAWDTILLAVNN